MEPCARSRPRPGVTDRPGLTGAPCDTGLAADAGAALEPSVTDEPGCTLDAGFTTRPGVAHRPGLTWCALRTRLTTATRPTLRPGVTNEAGRALRTGLTARPGVPHRPGRAGRTHDAGLTARPGPTRRTRRTDRTLLTRQVHLPAVRQHLRRGQRPLIVPHLVNDAPETVGVVRASANDHPNVFDIKRSMTRQHAILDTIDVKARDTACRIMRRRHMVQPPRFKGRLSDHFLIVEFIGEVIPQIPRTRDRQVIRFKPQPHNEINRLRCEVVTNDESLKRQRTAQPAGLISSPHRTRAAKTQRVAQRAILNPRDARRAQRTRPAAHRGHIFHSHASSRTEGPVQIDAAAKHRGPEAHLTRRTMRAGDPDRTRPTLWPSVAAKAGGTLSAGLATRLSDRRSCLAARCDLGALDTRLASNTGRPCGPVSPTRPVAWTPVRPRGPVYPTGPAAPGAPGAVSPRMPRLALRPSVANRPSCALDTGLTAWPGVPTGPVCTWCALDPRLATNAGPTLRPGVANKASGTLRTSLARAARCTRPARSYPVARCHRSALRRRCHHGCRSDLAARCRRQGRWSPARRFHRGPGVPRPALSCLADPRRLSHHTRL